MREKRYYTRALKFEAAKRITSSYIRATKHKNDVDLFVERLRGYSKFIRRYEYLDKAMLYSIAYRVKDVVDDLSKVSIVTAMAEKTIKKKMTQNTFIVQYNTEKGIGTKIHKKDVIPIWGYPILGDIFTVKEINCENDPKGKILYKCKSEPEFLKEKIYINLIKITDSNDGVTLVGNDKEVHLTKEFTQRYELVLIKSYISSNIKL